jgi:hexosaminidase
MRLALSFSLCIVAASALWPQPISYEHGDTVLSVEQDVPFYCYEVGARNVGSIADQQPFLFAQSSDIDSGMQADRKLRKRYVAPFSEVEGHHRRTEGVSGDDIIDYAIKSAWKTIFEQNLYPWKFHPRGWEEPQKNGAMISEVNVKLLTEDPVNVAKPLVIE